MGRFSTLLAMAVALVMMALVQGSMANTWMVGGPLGWSTRALSYGSHSKTFYQDWVQSNFPYCNNDIFGKQIFIYVSMQFSNRWFSLGCYDHALY